MGRGAPADAGSKTRLRLWLRLLRAQRRVEGALRERLRREFGTTLPRFDVLAALHRRPQGLRMSELSRMLMVSNGNVTGIVDRLCDDGLLTRAAIAGDRRATRVSLTDRGQAEFEKMAAAHEAWVDELLCAVAPEEAEAMLRPLERAGGRGRE